jgi:Rrf2 family transcriptional regulator, iron-sulfur cluster assembly transcription factor
MKLSTRSRYGTRLMLELAEHHPGGPVQLRAIAKRQGIPIKYLEQIIIPLKKAGFVTSVRGYRGGHMLAKDPRGIKVGEIVALMEGGHRLTVCSDNPEVCERSESCVTRWLWKEATEAMYERLNAVTLADLVMRVQAHGKDGILGGICDEEQE